MHGAASLDAVAVPRMHGAASLDAGETRPEPDFSPESTTRGGGCPDGPSKQAFGPKMDKNLSKFHQLFPEFSANF